MKPIARKTSGRIPALVILAALLTLAAACNGGGGGGGGNACNPVKTVYLRADVSTKTMPDGREVTMWGYAADSRFEALDGGSATSPGPLFDLRCARTLIVHLDNNLPVPTSLVINGQHTELVPVRNPDGRVRSFTQETPPGNTERVTYVWNQLEPGTYMYMSGTHPAVQVQMGLYGPAIKDADVRLAYPGHGYDEGVMLLYSEIDPVLHDAVAADDYGPGKLITSTIDYNPRYFLINGEPYTQNGINIPPGYAGKKVLIRIFNAGLKPHALMAVGAYGEVIAEDGHPYNYPRRHYSLLVEAGKTKDVMITIPLSSTNLVIDRMLNVSPAL